MISSDYKNLQESTKFLIEVNQEFDHENDKLNADFEKYKSFKLLKNQDHDKSFELLKSQN